MNESKLQALLSAYASGTLTAEEQAELFQAALEKQEIFDALVHEHALREALDDPQIRSRLLAQLQPAQPQPSPKRGFSRFKWAASLATILLVAGVSVEVWRNNHPAPALPREEKSKPAATKSRAPQVSPAPAQPEQSTPQVAKPAPAPQPSHRKRLAVANKPPPQPESTLPEPAATREIAPQLPAPSSRQALALQAGIARDTAVSLANAQQKVSPRLLFQSEEARAAPPMAAAKGFMGSGVAAIAPPRAVLESKAKKPAAAGIPAIRVTLHLPGQTADLDWRAASYFPADQTQSLILDVNTATSGYLAVLQTPSNEPESAKRADARRQARLKLRSPSGGAPDTGPVLRESLQRVLLPGDALTLAGGSVRAPLIEYANQQQPIVVIYSPAPLTPDRIAQALNATTSIIEETHNGPEHAIYATASGQVEDLVVRFSIHLH